MPGLGCYTYHSSFGLHCPLGNVSDPAHSQRRVAPKEEPEDNCQKQAAADHQDDKCHHDGKGGPLCSTCLGCIGCSTLDPNSSARQPLQSLNLSKPALQMWAVTLQWHCPPSFSYHVLSPPLPQCLCSPLKRHCGVRTRGLVVSIKNMK
jgi:hypothetical protein